MHRDPAPLVILAAVTTIILGASLAPSRAFDQNPSYSLFAPVCDEWMIGGLLIALGVAKLLALIYSRYGALRWLLLMSAATWEAMAAGVLASWTPSGVPPMYAAVGLMSLWAYLMLGVGDRGGPVV